MAGIEAWRWEPTSPFGSHLDELTKHSIQINNALKHPVVNGTAIPAV
jgi:hypothetical protein